MYRYFGTYSEIKFIDISLHVTCIRSLKNKLYSNSEIKILVKEIHKNLLLPYLRMY